MNAALFRSERTIEVGERPDPTIQNATDAVVRVVRGCVCGSDLWYYRGLTFNDGTCPACRAGFQSNCTHGGAFVDGETDGGQGEYVRFTRRSQRVIATLP